MATAQETRFHDDGTVRYWSIFAQQWRTASRVEDIPDNEYEAMTRTERAEVIGFFGGGAGYPELTEEQRQVLIQR